MRKNDIIVTIAATAVLLGLTGVTIMALGGFSRFFEMLGAFEGPTNVNSVYKRNSR